MLYLSPQLSDDIIKQRAMRPGTINNPSSLVAAHGAGQMANTNYVKGASERLGLARDRLGENKRQFDERYGFAKDRMNYQKRQNDIATGIGALSMGVSVLDRLASDKAHAERLKTRQSMIDDLVQDGSKSSVYFAELLKLIEV